MLINMAKWKLSRLQFGKEEFELTEGEVTIGRGFNNLIKLSSIVISRNHCIIKVTADEVVITDLKSSNGVYVGRKKITPEISYKLKDNDIIGFGWTIEASLDNIKDHEKHVYKLINDKRKRKLSQETVSSETENENGLDAKKNVIDVIVTIENKNDEEYESSKAKKAKAEPILIDLTEDENEDLEYKVFKDTQDNIYNDEPELILSDSDYESEHLLERLSQNSPGRSLKNLEIKVESTKSSEENNCYNQIDDDIPIDLNEINKVNEDNDQEMCKSPNIPQSDLGDSNLYKKEIEKDLSDEGSGSDKNLKDSEKEIPSTIPLTVNSNESCVKKQIIEPLINPSKKKLLVEDLKSNSKAAKRNTRSGKKSSTSANKIILSNSQKEKRRTKLKEITIKEKEKSTTSELNTYTSVQEFTKNNVNGNINEISEEPSTSKQAVQNNAKTNHLPPPRKTVKIIDALYQIPTKTRVANVKKPLIEKVESNENLPPKKVEKKVRFSDAPAEVHTFLIEPGQRFEKLSSIKKENRHLIDGPKKNRVSQKKVVLEKILKWNTQWLEVQMIVYEPPPEIAKDVLGTLFLSFRDHEQYMKQVGTLLLLEIWEYVRQGYKDNKTKELRLTIETLPPKPPKERNDELFTICVKLEISTSNQRVLPRYGDMMIMKSKSDKDKWRFCFVNNVTYISSSAHFKTYCLHLFVKYTYQVEGFSLGEVILGRNIANINNVILLFEAIERLGTSPLKKSILRPEPCQYSNYKHNDVLTMKTKWTEMLNASQLRAVRESVSAALGEEPALRMVQGPPGTGKSSVICAMVMSYFYDGHTGRKQSKRGKILICATSNFAVDELVIKLSNMRETLPPEARFRLVRVGRLEAMHGRAREISSQELAQREQARVREGEDPAVREQIELYQAKMNRWKTEKTWDAARAAYCKDRVAYCARQIEMLRGAEASPHQLLAMEHRLLEGADVIATTLSSAVNHKMRSVTGIELCIVDEAGQAIEPEALLPLMLGVTKLTLVGDPQQLPGFICSQHAKKYGLDKSLFSRLSSCSEEWERRPEVLLDRQYRMHPAIADYPNRAFYGGKVQSVPPAPVRLDLPSYCILGISGREDPASEVRGASLAAAALALAARAHRPPLSVAVITPYVAHRDHMRAYLGDLMREWGGGPVEVNTVDSFQGQERDVVVVSLGRRRGVGFLADAGRMNVLLTRARHVLLVCLDPDAVREHEQWRTLVEDAKTKNLFKKLSHKMCQSSSSRRYSPEEVLKFLRSKQKH